MAAVWPNPTLPEQRMPQPECHFMAGLRWPVFHKPKADDIVHCTVKHQSRNLDKLFLAFQPDRRPVLNDALSCRNTSASAFNSASLDVDRRATRAIVRLGLGLASARVTRVGLSVSPPCTAIPGTSAMPSPDSTICTRVSRLVASMSPDEWRIDFPQAWSA